MGIDYYCNYMINHIYIKKGLIIIVIIIICLKIIVVINFLEDKCD
eukprot:NODE_8386_length_249_cov_52.245000_g7226_i0.p1 GENE.NODE_8386_length_249_cov_52.245000_g7226_i0~~NODE_8386_length_249_cov_52.245000_g7226_i0.p1  ORF type:complete len:55 (-),score=18.01 NODE_8386_length_249_cov_52.245000_g7226_i0:85-219(-)